jgi:hypothetical protein
MRSNPDAGAVAYLLDDHRCGVYEEGNCWLLQREKEDTSGGSVAAAW